MRSSRSSSPKKRRITAPPRFLSGKPKTPKTPDQADDGEFDEELDLPLHDDVSGSDDEGEQEGELDDFLPLLDDPQGQDPLDDESTSDLDTGVQLDPLDD